MKNNNWVEISKDNLIHNLKTLKSKISDSELMFVVKANAYGHNMEKVVQITESQDDLVDDYGVHSIKSAVKLRKFGIKKDIYVLGYVNLDNIKYLFEHDFIHVVTNMETLNKIIELSKIYKKSIRINLKCETGTNRQGILLNNIGKYFKKINDSKWIELEGLISHFANIEDTTNHQYTTRQLDRFENFIKKADKYGLSNLKNHIACSAAIILFPKTHYQMVRAGISSYGLWSSKETYISHKLLNKENNITLKPVLTWKTIIGQIKTIPAGSYIGYGCTYKTTTETKLAILPVGYYDGYDRRLSNKGYVLINGKRAPIRGRVCMNMIIVDITHVDKVNLENEVILLGKSGNEEITPEELASKVGTINYEIVDRINPLIERIIV